MKSFITVIMLSALPLTSFADWDMQMLTKLANETSFSDNEKHDVGVRMELKWEDFVFKDSSNEMISSWVNQDKKTDHRDTFKKKNNELITQSKDSFLSDNKFGWELTLRKDRNLNCSTCATVVTLPEPKPLFPCNDQTKTHTHITYGFNASLGAVSTALKNKNYAISRIDDSIKVILPDYVNKDKLFDSLNLCEDCAEVDPVPEPKPIVIGCQ